MSSYCGCCRTAGKRKPESRGRCGGRGGIKTPEELLRLILLYLTEGKSFRGTSALMRLAGEAEISDVAALKRMRNSAAWLQWLCENIHRRAGLTVPKPLWLKNKNVKIAGGSEDVKCGVRRQCYMPRYSLDLFTMGLSNKY